MIRYALLLFLLPLLQDPNKEDPEFKGWARCKPGSWVRVKTETQGLVMETTSTLKSVAETSVLLEDLMTTTFQGKTTKDDKPKERKVEKMPPANVKIVVSKEGDEELTIDGKKVACHWQVMESQRDGKKYTMKMWWCDAIPGGFAKGEGMGTPKPMKLIVTGWEMK